jgi:pantetheine-phosphate adenylyltransferase
MAAWTPEQIVMSAAQDAAAGTTPGQAPVSAIATPSPAAMEGSQGPASAGPPSGAGPGGSGAPTSTSGSPAGPPCAHPKIRVAVVNKAAWRMCPQTDHAKGRAHACRPLQNTFDLARSLPQDAAPMPPRIALYPGSFDPPTNGHLSIIQRGLKMFDGLIVAVLKNPAKDELFSVEERVQLLRGALNLDKRVQVKTFSGLLVKFAEQEGVNTVLRGLRAVSDFEYEFQMANMNRKLDKEIETLFMMTGEDYFYISSRFVRDVARLGGDVSGLVPSNVLEALKKRFK